MGLCTVTNSYENQTLAVRGVQIIPRRSTIIINNIRYLYWWDGWDSNPGPKP